MHQILSSSKFVHMQGIKPVSRNMTSTVLPGTFPDKFVQINAREGRCGSVCEWLNEGMFLFGVCHDSIDWCGYEG